MTQTLRTKQAAGLKSNGAVDMTTGTGKNLRTFYVDSLINKARENGVAILVAKRTKNGVRKVLTKARAVHRDDLTETYNDDPSRGKYIKPSAIKGKVITGAQNVSPYLRENGSMAVACDTFKSTMPKTILSKMVADHKTTRDGGDHVTWRGKVVIGGWMSKEMAWARAQEIAPKLKGVLSKNKSQVKGVKEHLGTMEKFVQNIDVMRRTRSVFNVVTGERDLDSGGATPYGRAMEQCGFAIDRFYLTTGFDDNGNEVGDYFYRLAIGRSEPHVLNYRDWRGLDAGDAIAYLTPALQKKAKARK